MLYRYMVLYIYIIIVLRLWIGKINSKFVRIFMVIIGGDMKDFLTFRRMITPILLQIVYWVASIFTFVAGIVMIFTESGAEALGGLAIAILGPIVIRIYAEVFLVIFRMNETLTEIKNNTNR